MNKKAVKKTNIKDNNDTLAYWLSRPVKERIAAVEILRKQFIGSSERFQRTIRVIQQS